jgi:hypothetical protein
LTYNILNIPFTARHIKLIRLAPLRRPLMLLGMAQPLPIYLACLALREGLSAFDECLWLMTAHPESSPIVVLVVPFQAKWDVNK